MNRGRVRHMIANHDVLLRAEVFAELESLRAEIEAANREPLASEARKIRALEARLNEFDPAALLVEELRARWLTLEEPGATIENREHSDR